MVVGAYDVTGRILDDFLRGIESIVQGDDFQPNISNQDFDPIHASQIQFEIYYIGHPIKVKPVQVVIPIRTSNGYPDQYIVPCTVGSLPTVHMTPYHVGAFAAMIAKDNLSAANESYGNSLMGI